MRHKFDPIPQEDYYRLQAVFAAVDRADKSFYADPQVDRRYAELVATQHEQAARVAELEADVALKAGPELAEIDKRLRQAGKRPEIIPPEYGYHSRTAAKAVQTKWVQVDLETSQEIAELVLVGCWDDFNRIGAGFGFPPRYRIELSDDPQFVRRRDADRRPYEGRHSQPGSGASAVYRRQAGPLRPHDGHEIGAAAERFHPGLGGVGGSRCPG